LNELARINHVGRAADIERIRRLADWLDARFVVPGTGWRFGLDGLIGLVPGVGDTLLTVVSLYIVAEAWRLGARKRTVARMLANVAVDAGVGAVPVAGDLFDFFWKANRRNLALLEADLRRGAKS
jgi:hypothetical protein